MTTTIDSISMKDEATHTPIDMEYALQRLLDRGFKAEIVTASITNEDGTVTQRKSIRVLHTPPQEKALAAFFANPDAPCDFPGCQELQRQYKQALEVAGGAACTACERGKIMRRMGPTILKAMGIGLDKPTQSVVQSDQNNESASTSKVTRVVTIPRSGSKSPEGALAKPSLLRRAATRIKKIFGAGS